MTVAIHGPGAGEVHAAGPATIVIKATGDDTAGSLFLSESTIAPGFPGPPPHWHERLHDMFYVLEGTLTLRVGDAEHRLEPGTLPAFRRASSTPSPTAATRPCAS